MLKINGENYVEMHSDGPITISRGDKKVVIVGTVSWSYSTVGITRAGEKFPDNTTAIGEFNLPLELIPELENLSRKADDIIEQVGYPL